MVAINLLPQYQQCCNDSHKNIYFTANKLHFGALMQVNADINKMYLISLHPQTHCRPSWLAWEWSPPWWSFWESMHITQHSQKCASLPLETWQNWVNNWQTCSVLINSFHVTPDLVCLLFLDASVLFCKWGGTFSIHLAFNSEVLVSGLVTPRFWSRRSKLLMRWLIWRYNAKLCSALAFSRTDFYIYISPVILSILMLFYFCYLTLKPNRNISEWELTGMEWYKWTRLEHESSALNAG